MELDQDTYNSIGDHLQNDQKQSHWFLAALVIASIGLMILLVWAIYI